MKLVVLGDLHLGGGYSLGKIDPYRQLNTRLLDHSATFDYVIDFMVEHNVGHLALTGDIYEHRRPEASQMAIFSEKLARLTELGIHTHIVVGNHDIVRAHKATTMDKYQLLKLPNVHVYNDIGNFHCDDPDTGMNLVFLPFRTRQMLQCWGNEEAVAFLKDRLQFEIKSITNKDPSVVIGHLTLQGSTQHGTSLEDHTVFDIILPPNVFDGFDAVLMGHIHQFQVLCQDPLITHIGSMERTDFGESDQEKKFALLEASKGKLSWEFFPLPVKPLYNLTIDKSTDGPDGLMNGIKQWIRNYGKRHKLIGSIVRIEITVGDSAANVVDTAEILKFMLHDMGVGNCTGVHTVVLSKRQLRDSTITEKADPKSALNKWLELNISDTAMREELRKAGIKIMEG